MTQLHRSVIVLKLEENFVSWKFQGHNGSWKGRRNDPHLAGVLCSGLKPGQVGKSRFKTALLKVMQRKCLLRNKICNSGMINLSGQISFRDSLSRG